MKIIFSIVILSVTVSVAVAGTITGNVSAQGKTVANDPAAGNAYSSHKYKFVEKVDYAVMHDFVVYVEGSFGTNSMTATNLEQVTTTRIAQEGAVFTPHVLPVVVGTTVEWPNNDKIYHNVFSMSDAKQFDLGLYKGNPPDKRVTFDKPGRVDVFCSIHTSMNCTVLVLENPYFASTDGSGNYKIQNVPPGKYKVKAWHDRLPADEREVTVPTNGEVKVDFVLGIKNLPQY